MLYIHRSHGTNDALLKELANEHFTNLWRGPEAPYSKHFSPYMTNNIKEAGDEAYIEFMKQEIGYAIW